MCLTGLTPWVSSCAAGWLAQTELCDFVIDVRIQQIAHDSQRSALRARRPCSDSVPARQIAADRVAGAPAAALLREEEKAADSKTGPRYLAGAPSEMHPEEGPRLVCEP